MSSQVSKSEEPADFWDTPDGLDWRVRDIANRFVRKAGNTTIVLIAGQLLPFDLEAYDWDTQGDDRVCDECQENEDNGPYPQDELPEWPAHPNCRCGVMINPSALGELT